MFSKHRSLKRLLFVVIAGALLWPVGVQPVFARNAADIVPATWYVSNTGDDLNSCSAPDAPCATINGAIAKATAGDTIDVAIGTYVGTGLVAVRVDKDITLSGGWDAGFTTQSGLSTIDGQQARSGLAAGAPVGAPRIAVVVDRFIIQNGLVDGAGSGIHASATTLTLSNSIVTHNTASSGAGSSIYSYNAGTLTVNSSTISGNTGGGVYASGTATFNNTTISGNKLFGEGGIGTAGIRATHGPVTLNNSTVSGNAGGAGLGIWSGNLTLNNTTVSGNGKGGIYSAESTLSISNSTITANLGLFGIQFHKHDGQDVTATLRNTILAGNAGTDCSGAITSAGYNLIGNSQGCTFTRSAGDRVGTSVVPIDPKLGPLAQNGGPTRTHALLPGSPAANAGNPAPSGGEDPNACLPTDQRGLSRLGPCDIGAYEVQWTLAAYAARVDANPSGAASVNFLVTFSSDVTGVDTEAPFSDFSLTTTGVPGASIQSVSGSGQTYTVTVGTGSGNGTIRLDVVDHDSIVDSRNLPLGGPGTGNGNFTGGQVYTISRTPVPISPTGTVWGDLAYKWSAVPGATQYRYQVLTGTTVVLDRVVFPTACMSTICSHTPTVGPAGGLHKWRVQAQVGGVWKASPYMSYTEYAPKAGYWKQPPVDYAVDFYVTPNHASVNRFGLWFFVGGCHKSYKVVKSGLLPISRAGSFSFTGVFSAYGAFKRTTLTPISATGRVSLSGYYVPYCGYVSGNGPWTASWLNNSQPAASDQDLAPFIVVPIPDAPFGFLPGGTFTLDP